MGTVQFEMASVSIASEEARWLLAASGLVGTVGHYEPALVSSLLVACGVGSRYRFDHNNWDSDIAVALF